MRTTAFLLLMCLLLAACGNVQNGNAQQTSGQTAASTATAGAGNTALHLVFSLPDAEKILGEPAHVKDSGLSNDGKIAIYQSSYMATTEDSKTGKTGNIYFMADQYGDVTSAHTVYDDIKKANEKNGIRVLTDLGDEAYFHTDGQNFYFIMARKGNRTIRMKVNKITSHTSLDQFNSVAKKVVAAL